MSVGSPLSEVAESVDSSPPAVTDIPVEEEKKQFERSISQTQATNFLNEVSKSRDRLPICKGSNLHVLEFHTALVKAE